MTIGKYTGRLIESVEKKGTNIRLSTVENAETAIKELYKHLNENTTYYHLPFSKKWYSESDYKLLKEHKRLNAGLDNVAKARELLKEKELKHKSFHVRQVKLREEADRESAKRLEAKKKRQVKAKAASKAPTMSKGMSFKNLASRK